ncbi:TRM11 family methyltransferase [Nocardiopsis sp. CNT312]|uniref:TRM11 family SAM-dependent methyltransferase n=1 Tax=Nocardiopsis sp. CNT312 TaxID=1137268 RepID=UPI0004B663EB|nr:DNA methyltransferase [Nocardiopsis sp. CNT312]
MTRDCDENDCPRPDNGSDRPCCGGDGPCDGHPEQQQSPSGAGWSVWVTGQQQAARQRGERYSRLSVEHPAKMLPAIARHAIGVYTRPGDLVLDPMCGIGTTLIEALHLGRDAVGIELEPKWASTARFNLQAAACSGAPGRGAVHTGDGAEVATELAASLAGRVRLVLTSPPYGSMTHGQVRSRRDGAEAVEKYAHTYTRSRRNRPEGEVVNLAYQRPQELLASFARILAACRPLLAPGGVVVVTARPFRSQGRLVDFPGQVAEAGRRAGLVQVDRCAALLCALREGERGQVVARSSFFQMVETRRLRKAGIPVHVVQHEDALVFTDPDAIGHERGAAA